MDNTLLHVRVSPGARRNEVTGASEGVWQIKVAAPPVEGRANRELVAYLSHLLGVAPSALAIVKGHTSRRKVIAVTGMNQEEVTRRLSA